MRASRLVKEGERDAHAGEQEHGRHGQLDDAGYVKGQGRC